jgi:hypothetical protein
MVTDALVREHRRKLWRQTLALPSHPQAQPPAIGRRLDTLLPKARYGNQIVKDR